MRPRPSAAITRTPQALSVFRELPRAATTSSSFFYFRERLNCLAAVHQFGGVLQLIQPLLLFLVELREFQNLPALIEEHRKRGAIGSELKGFCVLGNGNSVHLGPGGSRNLYIDGHMENADGAFHFLRLLHDQGNLMLCVVVRVGDVKLRGTGAVNPLIEKLLQINVIRFVNGPDQVRGDYVFAAIGFQVMPQAAIESIFANLLAKHVQDEGALSVGAVLKLAR